MMVAQPVTPGIASGVSDNAILKLEAQGKRIEVDDGEIIEVEKQMTFLHVIVIDNLYDLTRPFVRANKLGRDQTDGVRFILIGHRKSSSLAQIPDFSFIRAGRIPEDYDWQGDFEGVPDLAVEVVSPGQTYEYFLDRVAKYLRAGTEEVWLVYPERKLILQFRADAEIHTEFRSDEILTSPLFPGLEIAVAAGFAASRD